MDGASWATAWSELARINWTVVKPGDIIYIDGGSEGMTYTTTLTIEKSGSANAPITLRRSAEAGHAGPITIFGGRSTPLPFCGQNTYVYQTADVRKDGIHVGNNSWIVIDGGDWRGMVIYGHNRDGVAIGAGSSNVTLRNMEIYDNGNATLVVDPNNAYYNTWYPDQQGITLSGGTNNSFERLIIHDNGQDSFQGGGISNLAIRESWLYNSREHPSNPALAWNYCRHSDGIQIFSGGLQSGVLIENSILGPGLLQGTILGQSPSHGNFAEVDNVTIRNCLMIAAANSNIMGYPAVKSKKWTMDHLTVYSVRYAPDGGHHTSIFLEGMGHSLANSIVCGAQIYMPDGDVSTSGNFQFHTNGYAIGADADPQFANAPDWERNPSLRSLLSSDFTAKNPVMAGKGSSITTVGQLLSRQQSTPALVDHPADTEAKK